MTVMMMPDPPGPTTKMLRNEFIVCEWFAGTEVRQYAFPEEALVEAESVPPSIEQFAEPLRAHPGCCPPPFGMVSAWPEATWRIGGVYG